MRERNNIQTDAVVIPKEIASQPGYLGEKFSKPMAWIDLLLLSENGVVKASLGVLAERWKWSKNKVSRFLSDLEANRSVERSVCNFEGCKTEQSITILSNSYTVQRNDSESFHGTFQKEVSPNSPVPPSSFPPAIPPITSTPISPSSPFQEKCDMSPSVSSETSSPPIPKPLPPNGGGWRHPSSVVRASLGFNPDAIAEHRRELMAEELASIAPGIGMTAEAQEMFLVKWCEHNPGSDKIKADYEPTFNIKDRATQFMSWWKNHEHRDRDKEREDRLNPNAKWGR